MDLIELQSKSNEELAKIAQELGLFENGVMPRRQELLVKVMDRVNHWLKQQQQAAAEGGQPA